MKGAIGICAVLLRATVNRRLILANVEVAVRPIAGLTAVLITIVAIMSPPWFQSVGKHQACQEIAMLEVATMSMPPIGPDSA